MSWSTPHVFVVGELVSASIMNQYVSNEIDYLHGVTGTTELAGSLIVDQGLNAGAGITAIAGQVGIKSSSTPGTPTGAGILYVLAGALLYKGSSGTVTPIAPA